jgi:hypothetical protein
VIDLPAPTAQAVGVTWGLAGAVREGGLRGVLGGDRRVGGLA